MYYVYISILLIILDIQEFYELALQDESHLVTDEDISIAQKYIMDQFDAKVGLVRVIIFIYFILNQNKLIKKKKLYLQIQLF